MLASLLLSQGVPMLLAGDECRRTQRGNNNAYCQDNDISLVRLEAGREERATCVRFAPALIAFRRTQPTVRATDFLTGQPKFDGRPARRELVQRPGHRGRLARRRLRR